MPPRTGQRAFGERTLGAHPPTRSWSEYPLKPYTSHQQYIDDLQALIKEFPAEMDRKNSKGNSLRDVLKNAGTRKHYCYLRNGSVIYGRLSQKTRDSMAWGTTGNEALHMQLKVALHTVTQQHEASLQTKIAALSLGSMLTHNSAAYYPTLVQRSRSDLLSVIRGSIAKDFFPRSHNVVPAITTREQARAAPIRLSGEAVERRSQKVLVRQAAWQKQQTLDEQRGRVRGKTAAKKRTVFTQVRERLPRRKPVRA